ncbi:hypothetical protein N9255_00010 [bacterium]|nr:hypothetical protein [Akkermansiaceae bacterium]MDA7623751.1 hypothetical protein [Akkermansiaceae bacterium]MDA7626619.1 hypothetical protein [Akkermansiaceae bacterium]MDB4414291.1 hypothetical protein [bacterium]
MKLRCPFVLPRVLLGTAALSAFLISNSSSETVSVSALADLGEPSETVNTIGQSATYQNRTVGGVEAVTTKDATFAVSIDFNAGDSASNGVIWESGGATIGTSVSYNQAAATLSLHHSTNSGNALGVVTHQLTDAQVSGGEVEVVWAYDASEIEWELFVDGASSGTTVDTTEVARTQNNWSGANAAGFGIFGGNFAAGNGDNTNLAAIANLGDTATINLDTGLRFWAGTDLNFLAKDSVVIPEGIAGPIESGQNRGFRVVTAQAPLFSEISNSFARASQQLNGTLASEGQLVADEAKKGENPEGSFDVDVINFLEAFDVDGFPFVTNFEDDANFPGIPGTGDHYSLFTTEISGFVELSAGTHTFDAQVFVDRVDAAPSNDNGLVVLTGNNPRDFFATELATFVRPDDAPPFESTPWDFQFNITAPVDGIYPIRLVYWTQSGNSGLEFSQQNQLVNSDGSTVVFRESTAPRHSHAYIAEVSPVPGVADISPEEPITILLRDDKTTVNIQSVKLSFNGVDITGQATVSSGNSRTTINYQPPPARQSDRNELVLEYMDSSGESFTREWSFANSLGEKPPMVTGQWDFSNGLSATIGSDLIFNDEVSESETLFGTTTSFKIADIGGESAEVMYVPFGSRVGYKLLHGIAPNGGGRYVNRYTLLMDVMRVGGGGASAIIQASPTKNPGDATFFWQGGNMGQGGGGYNGDGTFTPDEWHRIGFAVDLADEKVITKWVDGVLQDEWRPQNKDHIRRAMEPETILFYDVDERSEWYVNSIQILDGKLSDEEMEALGGPGAEGFEAPGAKGLQINEIVLQEDGNVTIKWYSRANRSYRIEASSNLVDWLELTDGHPSQGDLTEFTELGDDIKGAATRYYRVTEE